MPQIYEILKLNLEEDIKNVIDIEDRSEAEVKYEIDSYIVTENIGRHFSKFASEFTSEIKETGVWISGFYGSGKSYFGKMLGYVLENSDILGTPAAERFIQRLAGLKNAGLIENDIRSLASQDTRVVALDIAKQSTSNGLAFTLFRNFLKSLGFLDNVYGYMEFSLFLDGKHDDFRAIVQEINGADWSELRKNSMKAPLILKRALTQTWYSEAEYEEMRDHLNTLIREFSANKLKEELENYLGKKEEKIVFIFDEASEAISQNKYDLLELEGLSEAMSGIASKVWTVAIAQEKLNDVINNSNISKSQLIKVTDRFKTKLNLESSEVDIIIRNRLLQKKERFYDRLQDYYNTHEGMLADATNLKSSFPTKVENAAEYAEYYPFHKYQFDLLQRFLFSSNALAATQAAARGMLITTFDVLRKRLKNRELFEFASAFFICDEAQTAPPSALVNKYANAAKILQKKDIQVNGVNLLKTVHFLTEAELVATTSENITKAYLTTPENYFTFKPQIEEALNILTDARILLFANNRYRITSDLETKLLDEMNDFHAELFIKKRNLITYLKKSARLKRMAGVTEKGQHYSFHVISDLDDEIFASSDKYLQVKLYSLYSLTQDREEFIENVKLDTQYEKGCIAIIPQIGEFNRIDLLLEDIQKSDYMLEKYGHDADADVKQIIREFAVIRDEKEKELTYLIDRAYTAGAVVYLFDALPSDADAFTSALNGLQQKVVKNVYTKRPSQQLSEKLAWQMVKEKNAKKLCQLNSGAEFNFFDAHGNFIGDSLKVAEEVNALISSHFTDGKSIEIELRKPPTGYEYGTVASVLAALFRAGRAVARFKGDDYFSYKEAGAADIFKNSLNFKKTAFKALTKALTTAQKSEIVQILLDLKYQKLTGATVDWNTYDFQLADAIGAMAVKLITVADALRKTVDRFDALFSGVNLHTGQLAKFTGKTTESNYIDRAVLFINCQKDFKAAVKGIRKIENFVKKNLGKINAWQRFVDALAIEMDKAAVSSPGMAAGVAEFRKLFQDSIVTHFGTLLKVAQALKDEYFALMQTENVVMTQLHTALQDRAQEIIAQIDKFPAKLNTNNRIKAQSVLQYARQRINPKLELVQSIQCQNCNMSLSEMKSSIALIPNKETELTLIQSGIVREVKPTAPCTPTKPQKITLNIHKKTTVKAYREVLYAQIQNISNLEENDTIEIDLEEK